MASALALTLILLALPVLCLCRIFAGGIPACPSFCTCRSGAEDKVECQIISEKEWMQTCQELNEFYGAKRSPPDLRLQRSRESFIPAFSCLPSLSSLALGLAPLKNVNLQTFQNVQIASDLDLSGNNISHLSDNSFAHLGTIQSLNLSRNLISTLTNETFNGLHSLRSLDLSHNKLEILDAMSFTELANLEFLNLAYNKLAFFSSWHLPSAFSLRVLILQGNNLKQLDLEKNKSVSAINFLSALDMSHNPIECSCVLEDLMKNLQHHNRTFMNPESMTCKSPKSLQNLTVLSVTDTVMTCSNPRNLINYPSHEKSVVFKETISLECRSDGYPPPSIIWITPWGEIFAHSPDLISQQRFIAQEAISQRKYEERNVDVVTTISVNEKNDLLISHFRGSISGNFTCVAFNVAGNKSETIHLTIASILKSVYMHSLFIGGYTASGFLIFGFLVGFIKMIVVRLKHRICFTVPIFSSAPSFRQRLDSSTFSDGLDKDCSRFSDVSPLSIEFSEPDSLKDLSPGVSGTPNSAEKRPLHLKESLEEARDRLRFGVGRKVESVRRNVQSIKISSSAYMQTIMESGSSAASRMKASMAQHVEAVKSHVQSFKELCGTGDMGMHTISMMSVETDIDTNEQTNIIKQITYV